MKLRNQPGRKPSPWWAHKIVFAAVMCSFIAVNAGIYSTTREVLQLRSEGITTEAVVTDRKYDGLWSRPASAYKIQYTFQAAAGRWYSGPWTSVPGDEWQKLNRVKVIYLPDDPPVNRMVNGYILSDRLFPDVPGILFLESALLFTIIFYIIGFARFQSLELRIERLRKEQWFEDLYRDARYSYIIMNSKNVKKILHGSGVEEILARDEQARKGFIDLVKMEHARFTGIN
ncbi:MAG: DUF3592 domain-containing protein [Desulfocucumaceae bacterium]